MPESKPTLSTLLQAAATACPHAVALIYGNAHVTYAAVLAHSNALAAGLHARAIARGDRVAICLPNVPTVQKNQLREMAQAVIQSTTF